MDGVLTYQSNDTITWLFTYNGCNIAFREKGPCKIQDDGNIRFSQISKLGFNRIKGPAYITPDGEISYLNNKFELHRTDGPAVIYPNGSKEYYIHDDLMSPDTFFLRYGVL